MKPIIIRNKKVILELLKTEDNIGKLMIAKNLNTDYLTKSIITEAETRKVPVEVLPRYKMPKGRSERNHEAIVGVLKSSTSPTLSDLISSIESKNETPFFLLINRLQYESNLGLVARTAYAAGVNGLIFQGDVQRLITEETIHYSMGAIVRIPIVKMSIFQALKEFDNYNIKTYAITMSGAPYYKQDLKGPVAFILGSEGKGLSGTVSNRCDSLISIPMKEGINSLNVGATAAIIMYEKVRQELFR